MKIQRSELFKQLRYFCLACTLLFGLLSIVGTGGGGGGGGSTGGVSGTIEGVAAAGPISGGTVEVFALNADGSRGNQLGSGGPTKADGSYDPIDIGSYSGPVLVVVTGGTYVDEATGDTKNNTELRTALSAVAAGGKVKAAVTPLTEIAVRLSIAGGGSLSIDQANSLLNAMCGVNIVNTLPVNILDSNAASQATVDQINLSLMLAVMSQMILDGNAVDLGGAMDTIKADLEDGQLDASGDALLSALDNFLVNHHNQSRVDNRDKTPLDDALGFIKDNPITPPENAADLIKAKNLVADLRNTILSISNDSGVGMEGILVAPVNAISEELNSTVAPALTEVFDRLGREFRIVKDFSEGILSPDESLPTLEGYPYGPIPSYDLSLYFYFRTGTQSFDYAVTPALQSVDLTDIIDEGTVTVTVDDPDNPFAGGTLSAAMMTEKLGLINIGAHFASTINDTNNINSLTLTGSMNADDRFSFDFSQDGRMLSITYAQYPGGGSDTYPTSLSFTGQIITTTARFDGDLDVPVIVYNSLSDQEFPSEASFTGMIQPIKDGSFTGVMLDGTLSGTIGNAADYNDTIPDSDTNFLQWGATFNGSIAAPSRPTIEAFLEVRQIHYDVNSLYVGYRTLTDGTIMSQLQGNGSLTEHGDMLSATLSNLDGLQVTVSYNDLLSSDQKLTGKIQTGGGVELAIIDMIEGLPRVKYADGSFETIP